MKNFTLKNITALFSITFALLVSFNANATKTASLFTKVDGVVAGTETSFTPFISFKGDAALFVSKSITATDETVTFIVASDFDDVNYMNFIAKLTDASDDLLSVGHKIGKIKTAVSNSELNWFNNKTLEGKNIAHLTLVFSNIKFETNAKGQTAFSYELTLNIFETEDDIMGFAAHDDDLDGIDFAYIDYDAMENIEGAVATRGKKEGKLKITKTENGKYIITDEAGNVVSNELKNTAIKIIFLSTKGAVQGANN
jgi:hypothetical protein